MPAISPDNNRAGVAAISYKANLILDEPPFIASTAFSIEGIAGFFY
jgi:hypothetical protein